MTNELNGTLTVQPGALNPENAPTIEPDPITLKLRGDDSMRDRLLGAIVHNANTLHMTFSELAHGSGLDTDQLRRILKGDAALTSEDADRLAHATGLSFWAACDEAEALPQQQDDTSQQAEGLTPDQLRRVYRLRNLSMADELTYRHTVVSLLNAIALSLDPGLKFDRCLKA